MADEVLELGTEENVNSEGLRWLLEMEMLDNPNVSNALILNVFKVSNKIIDVQLVTDQHRKRMLVYLKLTRWGSWFSKEKISKTVESMFQAVLPSYTFRITYDFDLLNRSIKVAAGEV